MPLDDPTDVEELEDDDALLERELDDGLLEPDADDTVLELDIETDSDEAEDDESWGGPPGGGPTRRSVRAPQAVASPTRTSVQRLAMFLESEHVRRTSSKPPPPSRARANRGGSCRRHEV